MRRRYAIHAAVIIGLLALLASQINFQQTGDALRETDPAYVAIVVLLNLPIAAAFGLRQHLVLRSRGLRLPGRIVWPAAVLGNVAGALTPAASGDLLRTAILRSHAELPAENGLALVAYERGLSLFGLIVGTLAATALLLMPRPWGPGVGIACLVLLALPLLGGPILRLLPKLSEGQESLIGRVLERGQRVKHELAAMLDDRALLLPWFTVTACIYALATTQYWLLTRSMSDVVSPLEAWFAFGASQLLGVLSLLPLGLGVADTSLAAFLKRAGMTLDQGAAVAILVRLTSTLPLTLMAIGCYVYLVRFGGRKDAATLGEARVENA